MAISPPRFLRTLRRTALQAIPTLMGVIALNFILMQMAPGDAADVMAGEAGFATEETLALLKARFGLDQPMLLQLIGYLNNLAHFSLGYSPRYNMAVADLIGSRLPGTLLLMGVSLAIATVVGVAAGAVMAFYANRWPDFTLSVLALALYSTPGFWVGLMLIVVFSVKLGLLPSGGDMTIGANLTGLAYARDALAHMILPGLALSSFYIAVYARLTRAAMLEVARLDFVTTAAAKGLTPLTITVRHVLRNALIPVTTIAGMHFGSLLGGAVVVETVFSWPGLGRLAFEAVLKRDFAVLFGVLLASSTLVIIANMLVDLLHSWLDPRIEAR